MMYKVLMDFKRDLAIILKVIPFKDRDQMITALTQDHGRISAIAKNSVHSRRFGGALEPFTASEWIFVERTEDFFSLNEARVRHSFEGLRKDLTRLTLASLFNELISAILRPGEACPDLFKLHSNALLLLENLDELEEKGLPLLNIYLGKLLQWSGHQPRVVSCQKCETSLESLKPQDRIIFNLEEAAWVCPDCRLKGSPYEVSAIALFDFLQAIQIPIKTGLSKVQGTRLQHEELFHFLESFIIFHVPGFERKKLKSLKLLDLQSKWQHQSEHLR